MYYNALVFKFTAKRIRSFGDRNSELLLATGNPTFIRVLLNHILRIPYNHNCSMCNILLRTQAHSHIARHSILHSRQYRYTTGLILCAKFYFVFILPYNCNRRNIILQILYINIIIPYTNDVYAAYRCQVSN